MQDANSKKKEKFYITTAIAYTSRKPHIGNTYEIVLTDAIARFKRYTGHDVFFCTGTDEHGQKIQELAEAAGISPKEYVDGVAAEIKKIWDLMNTSYDKFIRTTDDYHVETVQKIFKKLYDQGDIYLDSYEDWYCTPCESFWTETQLVDGKCPDCGREVHKQHEEAYFFKMSKYADRLMKYIEENPDFIQPEARKKEMINNFLKPGLQDLCVSRTKIDWGIPVPIGKGHTVYVWLDALTNYITALGYRCDEKGELYQKYWPADVHIIGKDILRFHTIYWPIFLMALGEPLPKKIFGHPWLLNGQDKMSKSIGNVIYADDLVRNFGVDAVRYYLLHEMPFAADGTITFETLISRFNSDLANTLGNLVNRTVSMINKYFDGEIPSVGEETEFDADLADTCLRAAKKTEECMDKLRVADAMDCIWEIVNRANKYIDETMPWALAKSDDGREKLKTVMYNLIEAIRFITSLLGSFMPDTQTAIAKQTGAAELEWESLECFGMTKPGVKVGAAEPLFVRLDPEKKLAELEAELAPQPKEEKVEIAPFKENVTIDDFGKLDIRVGKVVVCEKVPKSSKLLRFELEVGSERRQILSGIAKYYKPEDLIGKNVLFIANFPPRKMMGYESNGMILSAEHDGKLVVTSTLDDIQSGAEIV
ncbi:MAG: methionine--tRNA ligase [Eubacteriales bacterium]|nr:methionine--tRNA ligase [Eubacteriales bacterium]MDY5230247.1 methionine--tRNA ligase [Eubacteriales bacterium]